MMGPAGLSAKKGLLTRYCNKIDTLLEQYKAYTQPQQDPAPVTSASRTKELVLKLNGSSRLVSEALTDFTSLIDSLADSLTPEQLNQADAYIERAQECIDNAQSAAIELEAQRLSVLEIHEGSIRNLDTLHRREPQTQVEAATHKLPPIPIPTFGGKVWEFENFWTLFEANVHNQPLTNLQKFNYLISALRGEARESMRRFNVTEANYDKAVEFLRKKYGDESRLIDSLQMRLERARAESSSLEEQRRLLDTVMPIVAQLRDKGVSLDGSFLSQKVLSKFRVDLQRKVLERCMDVSTQEHSWILSDILSELDKIIAREERINHMVHKNPAHDRVNTTRIANTPSQKPDPLGAPCLFCSATNHKSLACNKYATIEERSKVFRSTNRCLNCGTVGHFLTNCQREGCRNCRGKKHHHTLCPSKVQKTHSFPGQQPTAPKRSSSPIRSKILLDQQRKGTRNVEEHRIKKPDRANAHTLGTDSCEDPAILEQPVSTPADEGTVLVSSHNGEVTRRQQNNPEYAHSSVYLLTGIAQVRDTARNQWKDVEILLDTGADESFISDELADELGLMRTATKNFHVYTFGTQQPKHVICNRTTLELWDKDGAKHEMHLHTLPVISAANKTARLTPADVAFIENRQIRLSKTHYESTSKPQILIGCDQLWELLEVSHPHYILPSGLHLIPSKFGYLLTGKQITNPMWNTSEEVAGGNIKEWPITINNFTNLEINSEEDIDRWDKYWTMDSAGICEFTGTKNAEKSAVNEEVSRFFEDTIQKRSDGYYIRFPFKKDHPPLPSNKAIALKRLRSVIQMLQKTPQLLEEYNSIFAAQEEKGIIEPVNGPSEGSLVHYIPHQPVVTPQKETTKLRIVFDASAHFKECPSLNDILHQGPLILPELYAILLRFRIPPYVAIADVEKAFLQVHLQETDRDVTRFLWVRDINAPLDDDNIIIYRFTRVTFGLNVSPYLLGGTIHHHLRCAVSDIDLADEIRENLYVDNLVLSGESSDEIAQKSLKARKIFSEMGMNLREFTSNNPFLPEKLPKEACATPTPKKVLGILWNAKQDHLTISCVLPQSDTITKRIVARQIASIYDPFGWLVPLIIPAKKFQQDLWRQKLQWDAELPVQMRQEWERIVRRVNGFTRSFPRRFTVVTNELDLAVFSDASEIALAACAYLFNSKESTLVMAKSKLPSIKTKTTIPKLEMNAVTMAMRLAHSIIEALQSVKSSSLKTIYVLSDSQIVLSWLSSPKCTNAGILVENRMREIRRIVDHLEKEGVNVALGYVRTSENSADHGTRGLDQEQLDKSDWWTGPQFLKSPVSSWPVKFYPSAFQSDPFSEGKEPQDAICTIAACEGNTVTTELVNWNRHNSFLAGNRIAALIMRFIKKTLRSSEKIQTKVLTSIPELGHVLDTFTPLQGRELRAAKVVLLRNHQSLYLTDEYRKSMENSLRLYKDEQGIWRSRGRLKHSALQHDATDPIFIMPNTLCAERLIQEAHGEFHRGIEHTMATVRGHYWIPKLRQQVRKLISHCIPCRKFNALPYRYPDTPDLPSRRVVRSYPFQHTGLDFFDLPPCTENGNTQKIYGCIFTCTVTRLVHLEVVRSMATEDFLNAFRRFVARRGIPESITCDNAPTFILSANILNRPQELHDDVQRVIANKGITWNYITPYAPWQGGFYERLIKSIKHALYKALTPTRQRSFDGIHTIVTEIEACLNSRPLTYQGSMQEELTSVRPVDFLQNEITLTFPEIEDIDNDDPLYLPSEVRQTLQYRQQVIFALKSSIQETEKFWTVWQQQYLTALRETQKRLPTGQRLGRDTPAVGDIVLVHDPVLPRHEWKMARITATKEGRDGEIREVELQTSKKKKIRRPVNWVIPLEIQKAPDKSASSQAATENEVAPKNREISNTHRYNLRRRQPKNYAENNVQTLSTYPSRDLSTPKWFLFYIMILALFRCTLGNHSSNSNAMQLSCTEKGVLVNSTKPQVFEICADTVCKIDHVINKPKLIHFPPEITLHEHNVILKWHLNNELAIIETLCEGIDFCANIDCWACTSVLLNPECWPLGAIFIFALGLYGIIALLYALLYVPLTVGKPLRLLSTGIFLLLKGLTYLVRCACLGLLRKFRSHSRSSLNARLAAALAIVIALSFTADPAFACQEVNVFEHHATICTNTNGTESCSIKLTEVLKLNSFTQTACLRLIQNSSLVAHVKVRWMGLYLRCEEQTEHFTRSTETHVIDSKRCPYRGSCSGEKCAGINSSSLIPELDKGNSYPGRTDCFESCGGFGCLCGSFSSGCLFFRLYAKPKSTKIYRIFRCLRWTEEVKLEVVIETANMKPSRERYIVGLIPNVPIDLPSLQITMTSLAMPPMPQLTDNFITDGIDTAIYTGRIVPNLFCETQRAAETLNCTFSENCKCAPAETKVRCECPSSDVAEEFSHIELKLPVKSPSWELKRGKNSGLTARIPHLVSSEIFISFHHTLDLTQLEVRNLSCTVENTSLNGCYNCAKGAIANVKCISPKETQGEVLCASHTFVIPCAPSGPVSALRFHLGSARQFLDCTISCGTLKHSFKLDGILKYVNTFHYPLLSKLQGSSSSYHGFSWPDFGHIFDVLLYWYKSLILVLVAVALSIFLIYICLTTIGVHLLKLMLRIVWILITLPFRIVIRILARTLTKKRATPNAPLKKWA